MSDSVGMSFKAKMNNLAKKLGLRPQTVIQNYMFERFLARLAQSPYRENFVVKGGVLIAAMIGLLAHGFTNTEEIVARPRGEMTYCNDMLTEDEVYGGYLAGPPAK